MIPPGDCPSRQMLLLEESWEQKVYSVVYAPFGVILKTVPHPVDRQGPTASPPKYVVPYRFPSVARTSELGSSGQPVSRLVQKLWRMVTLPAAVSLKIVPQASSVGQVVLEPPACVIP